MLNSSEERAHAYGCQIAQNKQNSRHKMNPCNSEALIQLCFNHSRGLYSSKSHPWTAKMPSARHMSQTETVIYYSTITDAYHSVPRAALGLSDHCLLHLIPAYRQKLKSAKPVLGTVKRWTNEAERDLQACFD